MENTHLVRFKFTDSITNHRAIVRAAAQAFCISEATARLWLDYNIPIRVTCTPAQFAEFLIYRSHDTTNNAFQQFEAKLIPAPVFTDKVHSKVDVTEGLGPRYV